MEYVTYSVMDVMHNRVSCSCPAAQVPRAMQLVDRSMATLSVGSSKTLTQRQSVAGHPQASRQMVWGVLRHPARRRGVSRRPLHQRRRGHGFESNSACIVMQHLSVSADVAFSSSSETGCPETEQLCQQRGEAHLACCMGGAATEHTRRRRSPPLCNLEPPLF